MTAPQQSAGTPGTAPGGWWSGDGPWVVGTALVALAVVAVTFSGGVSGGDAPESVAGVRVVGILHAPGYPTYVLAARLWTLLVPFGSFTARVNSFSAACAIASAALLFVTARRFGASRLGALTGVAMSCLAVSFWFHAGFAKHDALSYLLIVAAFVLALRWRDRGGLGSPLALGLVLGLSAGAAWEVAALAVPGLVALVLARRRPPLAEWLAVLAAGAVVTLGLLAWLVVRAGQNPALDWGRPTTIGRVVSLVLIKDFQQSRSGGAGTGATVHHGLLLRMVRSPLLVVADVGWFASLLAFAGAAVLAWPSLLAPGRGSVPSRDTRPRGRAGRTRPAARPGSTAPAAAVRRSRIELAALAGILLLNVAAVLALGVNPRVHGEVILRRGGFLLAAAVVIGIWLALGVTLIESAVHQLAAGTARRAGTVVAVVVVAAGVAWEGSGHYTAAQHRVFPAAPEYARHVLDALPPNAVLVSFGAERAFPIQYEQLVEHYRPDVRVIVDSNLGLRWYREVLVHQFGAIVPLVLHHASSQDTVAMITGLRDRGAAVFLDVAASEELRGRVGERIDGLVTAVTAAPGTDTSVDAVRVGQTLDVPFVAKFQASASRLRWPNLPFAQIVTGAWDDVAVRAYQLGDKAAARAAAERAVAMVPSDGLAAEVLSRTGS